MNNEYAIIADAITKTYEKGKIIALQDVSFRVKKGELFGLIGPDGAGKTSLFRILTTLLLADKGSGEVAGYPLVKDYRKIRERIGYMPGKFSLYQDLTVAENIHFFATLFGTSLEENYELVREIYDQIKPFKDRRAGALSGGMKQKLALCCALIHQPEVLFLDEPTTGVDVVSRRELWEMLKRLKEKEITILVSTPYMDEAIRCDRIALIQEGHLLTVDEPQNIIAAYPSALYAVRADPIYALLTDLRKLEQVESCYAFGEYLHLSFKKTSNMTAETLLAFAQQKGYENFEIKSIEASIEDRFISLASEKKKQPSPVNKYAD